MTVKADGETRLTAQTFDPSTREAVEGRFRRPRRRSSPEWGRHDRWLSREHIMASIKLASAATVMADTPAGLQLRLLQTIVEVATEKKLNDGRFRN